MMAGLAKKIKARPQKAVAVEAPVELLVDFMEQIDCQTDEEYRANAKSLIRQNPDLVYFTELGDDTAKIVLHMANTGKPVYSTLHANSIAELVSRLQDMTGLSVDRILLCMQSAIFQELLPVEGGVVPINRCVHFSKSLRNSLLGKSLGEVTKALQEVEDNWV